MTETTVHLLRHGEVYNPDKIVYERAPGFNLSAVGQDMAYEAADVLTRGRLNYLATSPLERAVQTVTPLAEYLGLPVDVDDRLIETHSSFGGRHYVGPHLRQPSFWWKLRNPFGPSWGERYEDVVSRMVGAIEDARDSAWGSEAVLVSHALPIWLARLHYEGRPSFHDPRIRQVGLCSITSLRFSGAGWDSAELVEIDYRELA